jgi:NAD(P)-dependent dehydrogenase (short-subunit alcohol dehydrogenase family)
MKHLQDKIVLITGGGSGMGQQAARLCAEAGAVVALLDVNEAGMADTCAMGSTIHAFPADITDFAAVQAATDKIESELGPIFRVYNAAAIMPFGKLIEQDNAVAHKIMDINYGGLLNISQAALPRMVERGEGEFISFASMAGIIPTMITGVYSASKAAVAFHTEILYHENINSGVKFACVCPPPVNTPLLQQGKDTHWPKMIEAGPNPVTPVEMINAIEDHLSRDKFWVFYGKGAKLGPLMRRLAPGLIWKQVHDTEGF